MSTKDLFAPNGILPESRIVTTDFFTNPVEHVSPSPIDTFISQLRDLVRLATPDLLESHPNLGGLIILGIISFVEKYVRNILSSLVATNLNCRNRCYEMQIRFGAVDWYDEDKMGLALIDRDPLSGSKEMKNKINNIVGCEIAKIDAIKTSLDDYESLCEIRHCIVHSAGHIGANNAQKLNLPDTYNSSIIVVNFSTIQTAMASMENFIRSLNESICDHILTNGFTSGDRPLFTEEWATVQSEFEKTLKLFWCTTDNGALSNDLIKDVFDKLKNRFD